MQKILKNRYIILNDLHKPITYLFFRVLRFQIKIWIHLVFSKFCIIVYEK